MTDTGVRGPKVSVITVCRNSLKTLPTTLDSVARQTYPNIEHIVIDGASTDGTREYLEGRRISLAVLVSEPDGGIYDAMNKGLTHATGDLIHFLNADDCFYDAEAVERAVRAIEEHPDAGLYYGNIEVRPPCGMPFVYAPEDAEKAAEMMVCGCLPHQGTFARRRVFDRTGPFDTRWRLHAEYDWFLKAIADDGIGLRHIPVIVASFALGGESGNLAKGQPEIYAIQNAATLYQTPEWQQRRIELYQASLLAVRMENAALKDRLAGTVGMDTALRTMARCLRDVARDFARRLRNRL